MKGIDILAKPETNSSNSRNDICTIIENVLGKSGLEKSSVFPNHTKDTCYRIILPFEAFSDYNSHNKDFSDSFSKSQSLFYELSNRLREVGFSDMSVLYLYK